MKNQSTQLKWLQNEKNKDFVELERQKTDLIKQIKKTKKEDILPKKIKLTLWQRIKRVLTI
jgi:hypothetical protein